MSIEDHKAAVRRFDRLVAACELGALDEICTPDMVNHALAAHRPPGLAGTKQFLAESQADVAHAAWLRQLLSDRGVTTVAEGDHVVQYGKRRGNWPGGRFRGVDVAAGDYECEMAFMYRFTDGRIAERWAVRDDLGMITQLSGAR
jgi:hypothetical protein